MSWENGRTCFPQNIGILAMEIYFPLTCVNQEKLETFDGVSKGKYTVGLGQNNMNFASNCEDVRSMSLTVVRSLMEKYNISYQNIGHLEVGTESLVDKSKSVKSVIMQLFQEKGNFEIEGVDCMNACYGGTAALFNAVNWIESSGWDGRLAIVVAADIAVYEIGPARPTGGCGAVAMLIGPDAPLVIESRIKSVYMEDVNDFYKPVSIPSEYAIVDGHYSIKCYMKSLDHCYKRYKQKFEDKNHISFGFSKIDYALFHTPFSKLVSKAFGRLLFNDFLEKPDNYPNIPKKYKELPIEQTYLNVEIEKTIVSETKEEFEKKVLPSLYLSKELGNLYCGSLYACLLSLLSDESHNLVGKRLLMFSYGSGLAATMFSIVVRSSVEDIIKKTNIYERIAKRIEISPEEFTKMLSERELLIKGHQELSDNLKYIETGTYYLSKIDQKLVRYYQYKL